MDLKLIPYTWNEKKIKLEELRACIRLFRMEMEFIEEALRRQDVKGKEAQCLWLRQRYLINAIHIEEKYINQVRGIK